MSPSISLIGRDARKAEQELFFTRRDEPTDPEGCRSPCMNGCDYEVCIIAESMFTSVAELSSPSGFLELQHIVALRAIKRICAY